MNYNDSLDNQQLRDGILGALVGLGRAAEGNKNRPTEVTDRVLIDGLRMVMLKDIPELMMKEQIKKIHEEKYKLVPRCTTCKKQCGRNDDYTVSDLRKDSNDVFNMKLRMLSEIILIAETGNKKVDLWEKEIAPSTELRKWYGHVSERYIRFSELYHIEINENFHATTFYENCTEHLNYENVTLLYASASEIENNAKVLYEWLMEKIL